MEDKGTTTPGQLTRLERRLLREQQRRSTETTVTKSGDNIGAKIGANTDNRDQAQMEPKLHQGQSPTATAQTAATAPVGNIFTVGRDGNDDNSTPARTAEI